MTRPRFLLRFLAAFLFLLSCPVPPVAAAVFNPESFVLENGLRGVVLQNARIPAVSIGVWYRVGAMDEPPGQSGVAHFLEHMMFKDIEGLEPGAFSSTIARYGGTTNAFTAQDYTAYVSSVPAGQLERVLALEARRMTGLHLSDESVEPERGVVLEERLSRIGNNPGARLSAQSASVFYAGHPYAIPIIGWEHDIRRLTTADLAAFYKAWYAPNNAVVIVSGDVETAAFRHLLEKHFGKIPAHDLPHRPDWRTADFAGDTVVTLADPQVRSVNWTRLWRGPSYTYGKTELAYPLEVLAEILGGSTSSRLHRSLVVEETLATEAGAWYAPTARGPTTFGLYFTPVAGRDYEEVAVAATAEIEGILDGGVTVAEVVAAVARMQAGAVYARDSLAGPGRIVGRSLVAGMEIEALEAWPERIGAVTVEAVNAAAREIFSGGVVTTILKPGPPQTTPGTGKGG